MRAHITLVLILLFLFGMLYIAISWCIMRNGVEYARISVDDCDFGVIGCLEGCPPNPHSKNENCFFRKDDIFFLRDSCGTVTKEYTMFLMIRPGDRRDFVEALLGLPVSKDFHLTKNSLIATWYLEAPLNSSFDSVCPEGAIFILYNANNKVHAIDFYGIRLEEDRPLQIRLHKHVLHVYEKKHGPVSENVRTRIVEQMDIQVLEKILLDVISCPCPQSRSNECPAIFGN